jgi:hypothetical protein
MATIDNSCFWLFDFGNWLAKLTEILQDASMDQDKMGNLYKGHSIDASYQFRFTWPSGFSKEDI